MKVYDDARPHAASAWLTTIGGISKATKMFTNTIKVLGHKTPAAIRSFIRYWGKKHQKYGTVKGHASNSGRIRKLTRAQAKRCLDKALGWKKDGRSGPYSSVDNLISKCPEVKQMIQETGACPRTLMRAMKQLCPTFSYKKLTVKAKLSAQQKLDRVAVCKKHLQVPDKTLETVLWIDAKTMYMNITHRYGWVDAAEEDVFETNRPATRKSNVIKLKYYIAVNARLGAVYLGFYTGTTGMPAERDGKTYLVSSTTV